MNFSKVFRAVPYIAIFAILAIILLVNENLTNKGEFHGKSSPQAGYISLGTYGSNISGPESFNGNHGFPETVAQIMERDKFLPPPNGTIKDLEAAELPYPDRRNLPQDPGSMPEASYPPSDVKPKNDGQKFSPQSISTNFGAITVSEAGFIPPDNMGAVGPTQYIAIANGRIRSFNKTTGSADGALNTTTDNFFNSVRNGSGTSDPRIRYDRLSQKWFVVIINVSSPNRILIAVSNTSTITVSTTWLFYFINAPNRFYDYPTFGIDNNAVYIGTNDFNTALTVFIGCSGYVINKAGLIAGSSTPFLFSLVPNGSSDGPYTPQGVDNFDGSATEGYFIGVSNQFFGRLILRRVSTPGGVPTISSDITVTVNSTYIPRTVPVLGSNRPLDALDDRLFAACIRNGRLWTAHNFNVNSSGVASTTADRDGSRWYELQNLTTTPTVVQSGTIFDPAGADPVNYWIPSVMVSGQGHALFTLSSGGNTARANVSTVGRLSSDALGTTQSILNITNTSSNYNIQVNTTQRWGDYSYVSLDPNDDMTMWSVQEYCNATNSWAEQVSRLLAPPPPTLTSANPPTLTLGQPSIDVVITGTSSAGTAFYDPGSGFANRISAAIDGGVIVNSTTYNSQTQVTLNVSTVSATTGSKTVTITNPDGQSVSSSSILSIPLPVLMSSFTFSVDKRNVTLRWATTLEINNKGFDIERRKDNSENWQTVGFVDGHGTSNDPHDYSFNDSRLETGKYYYRLKQIDYNGDYERFTLNNVVAVGVPVSSDLSQNYPNPFNPLTKIDYNIPSDSKVEIKIYDITGREIAELLNEFKPAGYYTAEFDASKIASGIYFYRIFSEGGGIKFTKTMKMLVVK